MSQHRDGDMFELADDLQQTAVIKVVGVGGGGGRLPISQTNRRRLFIGLSMLKTIE